MSAKPFATALCCRLFQAKFFARANAAIKELVASRTEKPDHMPLRVRDDFPCSVSFEFWLVRYFKDSILAARFAGAGKIWIFSAEASDDRIFEGAARIINLLDAGMAAHVLAPISARSLFCATRAALSGICAGRHNVKMLSARQAVTASFCNVQLFPAPSPASASSTWLRTIAFVRSDGVEWASAVRAKEIIHAGAMP
jgi:hypothetical protein